MAQIKKVYRGGAIDCMIVQRTMKQSKQQTEHHRVIVVRRDRDASGTWHSSQRFTADDLPVMIQLIQRAHRFLLDLEVMAKPERPVDRHIEDIDVPDLHEIHDAILASQVAR